MLQDLKKPTSQVCEQLGNITEEKSSIEEAAQNVRKHLQKKFKDIPVYTIGADCKDRAFHSLMMKRYRRLGDVCSIKFFGKPVTPPVLQPLSPFCEDNNTYHIVRVLGRNYQSTRRSVSFIFEESNFYLKGFTPDPLTALAQWYNFYDASLPSFLNQMKLPYECSYPDISKIQIGHLCLDDIVNVLSAVTPENACLYSNDRSEALYCGCIMLSETQRSGEIQLFTKRLLKDGRKDCIGQLDHNIHNWSKTGRYVFEIEYDIIPEESDDLFKRKQSEIWKLMGRRRRSLNSDMHVGKGIGDGLLITLFSPIYTVKYMVNQKGCLPCDMKKVLTDKIIDTLSKSLSKVCLENEEAKRHLVEEGFFSKTTESSGKKLVLADKQMVKCEKRNIVCKTPPVLEEKQLVKSEKRLVKNDSSFKADSTTMTIGSIQLPQQNEGQHSNAGCLKQDDINSFYGNNWLTDNAIGFVFAVILANFYHKKLVLVSPSQSVLLSNSESSADLVHQLQLQSCSIAIIPINDQQFNPRAGGNHWSLLVLDRICNGTPRILHLDSAGIFNIRIAVKVAKVLQEHLQDFAGLPVLNGNISKQKNPYDCGLYVIVAAFSICKWWLASGDSESMDWLPLVKQNLCDPEKVGASRSKCLAYVNAYLDKQSDARPHSAVEVQSETVPTRPL